MKKHKSSTRNTAMKKMFSVFFAFLSVFMLLPLQPSVVAEAASVDDNYTVIMSVSGTSKALTKNKLYYSPNKTYACVFQSDGNLVVYRHRPWLWGDQVTRENAIWKSDTNGIALNGNCYLQKDGNLVVYASNGAPKFSTYHSYQNIKGAQLRLDNCGVLSVYYKPKGLFSDWTISWQSTYSPKLKDIEDGYPKKSIREGVLLKEEPKASLFVGQWIKHTHPQSENTSITIDFCENGKLKVTCQDLHLMAWGWDKNRTTVYCYIEPESFVENCSNRFWSDHRVFLHFDPIENSGFQGEIEGGDTIGNELYIDNEGEDLYLGNAFGEHFTRYEY